MSMGGYSVNALEIGGSDFNRAGYGSGQILVIGFAEDRLQKKRLLR
ncbi:hypothetical protein [Paenibacillus sp. NPDC058177]